MTVPKLQKLLRERGLDDTGKKAELVNRLLEAGAGADAAAAPAAAAPPAEAEEPEAKRPRRGGRR